MTERWANSKIRNKGNGGVLLNSRTNSLTVCVIQINFGNNVSFLPISIYCSLDKKHFLSAEFHM